MRIINSKPSEELRTCAIISEDRTFVYLPGPDGNLVYKLDQTGLHLVEGADFMKCAAVVGRTPIFEGERITIEF